MKRNIRSTIFFTLLPALFLMLIIVGCKKTSDTKDPDNQNSDLWLYGKVISAGTHSGIANARVYLAGQPVLTTDADGHYKINCKTLSTGTYDVRVMADGYCYGFAAATLDNSAATVNVIVMKPLAAPVSIGSAGGTVTISDPESLTPDGKTTMIIPAGALSGDVNITMTRFTGVYVPAYAPANMLNLCAVNLGPAGTVLSKPLELRFALPFADQNANNLPLMRYEFGTNNWVITGTFATVDHVTNIATVLVPDFGTYSLAIAGSFSESAGTSSDNFNVLLDPARSYVDLSYQAENSYPGGIPATVSLTFLQNIASQNTRINGTRTSFTDVTTLTFNYIGSKPDSLAPVKSTMSGYYRWVPQFGQATYDMPITTSILGITANGIIHKNDYSGTGFWQYIHDQGGGGK